MTKKISLKLDGYHKFLAPAKLNLFLKILNKRPDGYHNLQSVFQLINLYDEIYLRIRTDKKINFTNNSKDIAKDEDIGLQAAKLILKNTQIGADIYINKKIPLGSGMGGGSSNAATILMAINMLGSLGINKDNLNKIGLSLGADIPFFISKKNAWVEGVGEIVNEIKIPHSMYYICVPNIKISTESIFKSYELTKPLIPLKIATYFDSVKFDPIKNDLEETVIKKYKEMSSLLEWLKGFGCARMSGTGSSIFLLF